MTLSRVDAESLSQSKFAQARYIISENGVTFGAFILFFVFVLFAVFGQAIAPYAPPRQQRRPIPLPADCRPLVWHR